MNDRRARPSRRRFAAQARHAAGAGRFDRRPRAGGGDRDHDLPRLPDRRRGDPGRRGLAGWRGDVSRDVTIQIKPRAGEDVDAVVAAAAEIASRAPGVADAVAYTKAQSEAILAPWLGDGVDLGQLPIPRLIIVHMQPGHRDDLEPLRAALAAARAGGKPRRPPPVAVAARRDGGRDRRLRRRLVRADDRRDGERRSASPPAARWRARARSSRCCISSAPPIPTSPASSRGISSASASRGAAIGGGAAALFFAVAALASFIARRTSAGAEIAALFGAFALGLPRLRRDRRRRRRDRRSDRRPVAPDRLPPTQRCSCERPLLRSHRTAMTALRSLAFNVAFYVNIIVLMIVGLPLILFGRHGVFFVARLWGGSSLWLLEKICGLQGRIPRRREHSAGRLHPRRQAPVFPRNLRAARPRARFRHHPQAPAGMHPAVRALSGRRAADRHRPFARPHRADADRRPGARRARRRPADHHLSRGHAPAARRAAALQIRRRGDLRRQQRALPAGRAQHRPLLGPARLHPPPRRGGDRISAADPARPRPRRLRRRGCESAIEEACARLNAEAVAADPSLAPVLAAGKATVDGPRRRPARVARLDEIGAFVLVLFSFAPAWRWTDGDASASTSFHPPSSRRACRSIPGRSPRRRLRPHFAETDGRAARRARRRAVVAALLRLARRLRPPLHRLGLRGARLPGLLRRGR